MRAQGTYSGYLLGGGRTPQVFGARRTGGTYRGAWTSNRQYIAGRATMPVAVQSALHGYPDRGTTGVTDDGYGNENDGLGLSIGNILGGIAAIGGIATGNPALVAAGASAAFGGGGSGSPAGVQPGLKWTTDQVAAYLRTQAAVGPDFGGMGESGIANRAGWTPDQVKALWNSMLAAGTAYTTPTIQTVSPSIPYASQPYVQAAALPTTILGLPPIAALAVAGIGMYLLAQRHNR